MIEAQYYQSVMKMASYTSQETSVVFITSATLILIKE